jgi:hypothetical protein
MAGIQLNANGRSIHTPSPPAFADIGLANSLKKYQDKPDSASKGLRSTAAWLISSIAPHAGPFAGFARGSGGFASSVMIGHKSRASADGSSCRFFGVVPLGE